MPNITCLLPHSYLPGTEAKIKLMQRRAKLRVPLCVAGEPHHYEVTNEDFALGTERFGLDGVEEEGDWGE